MEDLIQLCTDVAGDTDDPRSSKSTVLEDALAGLASHRIFKYVDDEYLKFMVKNINQLLNERKTRTRGLMLFENFINQVDPDRLVAVQDSFLSTLSLVSKCTDLALTHRILVTLIPMCNKVPEFNQCVTSTILPKAISYFCEKSESFTGEEVEALSGLLERYRGPCGAHRNHLERTLLPYIDGHSEDFKNVVRIIPLLSAVGGGGNKGEKYSVDWSRMVSNVMITMHDTLVGLYGDVCPLLDTTNPYRSSDTEGEGGLNLSGILSPDVLVRLSGLSRRLCNLATLLGAYLSEPFPAAKPVPIRGIANLVCNMLLVNPVILLKNSDVAIPKENVFLAALLPDILVASFDLLKQMFISCGSHVLPEVGRIELQILHQLKWIAEKPYSFQNVKVGLYDMLRILLETTHGFVTSEKNAHAIAEQIFRDVAIEKQSVMLAKSSPSKGKKLKGSKGQVTAIIHTSDQVRVENKSEIVCSIAMETLRLLLPSLDDKDFREAYILVASNAWDFLRSSESLSPYCSSESRRSAMSCLAQFLIAPNPKSPVSVGLITNLLEFGSKDSRLSVSSHCISLLSCVERIIHPPCASLNFPVILPSASVSVCSISSSVSTMRAYESAGTMDLAESEEDQSINLVDSICQTDECEEVKEGHSSHNASVQLDSSLIKEAVAEALKENLDEFKSILSQSDQRSSPSRRRSSRRYDHGDVDTDDGSTTEEEKLSRKRRKVEEEKPKARGSHLVPAEQVHMELKIPLPKTNGYSHSNDLDDDSVDVSVEEMLLSFDDHIAVSN